MKQVIWTQEAKNDIVNIKKYIAVDSISRSLMFVDNLIKETDKLKDFAKIGKKVNELLEYEIREIIYKNTYRIIYSIDNDKVYIRFIIHTAEELRLNNYLG